MKFLSEDERMQHPQASLIPLLIWNDSRIFSRNISDSALSLMQAASEKLKTNLQALLQSTDWDVRDKKCFGFSIALGHPELSEQVLFELIEELHLTKEELFKFTCILGNRGIFEGVIRQYSVLEVQDMIAAVNYEAFREVARGGHLAMLKHLISLVPDKVQDMIAARNYGVFSAVAGSGHLAMLDHLISLAPGKVQDMVAALNYEAFRAAAGGSHLAMLEHLISLAPDKVQDMIAARNYLVFSAAARGGHLVLDYLVSLAPDKVQDMITARDYEAFRSAAQSGQLLVLERLISLAPGKVQDMISAQDYGAFRAAAQEGHLLVLEYLIGLAPDKVQDMLAAENYQAFCEVASGGHLAMLERLISLAQNKVQDMIAANDYGAFRWAARSEQHAVINRLFSFPLVFSYAERTAEYGGRFVRPYISQRLRTLKEHKHHEEQTNPHAVFDIHNREKTKLLFYFLKHLIRSADAMFLDEIRFLLEIPSVKRIVATVVSASSQVWRLAISIGNQEAAQLLLAIPLVFSYAELHTAEYGERFVRPYIFQRLQTLWERKLHVEQANPHVVFDIDNLEEATLLFYFLRYMIRCNDAMFLDEMRFLLEIPSVKRLVATVVAPSIEENELLRLAIRIGNQGAAELLLAIPEVQRMAAQQDYYHHEAQGQFDLRVLAQDRESSMTALSTGEQKRLKAVINCYQSVLKAASASFVMDSLRDTLETRYAEHPATVVKEGETVTLPLDWISFQALNFSVLEKEAALKAYYVHKDHSAWRYLSKPNPWMHARASYVVVNPENVAEKWSTFEEYQPLISLLFLAATDEEKPACNGYTLETRLEHFIDELAHIGRAHNWDKTRINRKGQEEEFDDLEGDRPSCYSGVKRRLFQSVLGHPLFQILTRDILKQEVKEMFFGHFQAVINEGNRAAIRKAWYERVLQSEEEEKDEEREVRVQSNLDLLKSLDISTEQQELFSSHLMKKYGCQFSDDENFKKHVSEAFVLQKDEAHVLKLAYIEIKGLLKEPSIEQSSHLFGFHTRVLERPVSLVQEEQSFSPGMSL